MLAAEWFRPRLLESGFTETQFLNDFCASNSCLDVNPLWHVVSAPAGRGCLP